MFALMVACLFSVALFLALATILHMVSAYRLKMIAALRRQHRPGYTNGQTMILYSPARSPRFSSTKNAPAAISRKRRYAA